MSYLIVKQTRADWIAIKTGNTLLKRYRNTTKNEISEQISG